MKKTPYGFMHVRADLKMAFWVQLWRLASFLSTVCLCELRSLAHSKCVDFNPAALRAVLKPENVSSSSQATQIPVRLRLRVHFKYASFYRRFQSFQSLFGSLFSLVSIAVWIYFNRLQNTGALELNCFVFKTFYLLSFWHPRVALKGTLTSSVVL